MTANSTGNAARQARYRAARNTGNGPAEERLDLHITLPARMALRRLAKHHGTSQKATLEQILLTAQNAAVDASPDRGATYYALLDPPPTTPPPTVTR